jgi:TolB protein
LAALKAGRSFATNGPLLDFTLGGKGLGEEVTLPAGGRELVARVRLRSTVAVDHLEIVRNGRVVTDIPLSGHRTSLTTSLKIPARESGWYLLRARGNGPVYPILDVYPYATTSPIYVTVAGEPVRSRPDAEYFVGWIDRLKRGVLASGDWNSEREKTEVLETIERARGEFTRRLGQ